MGLAILSFSGPAQADGTLNIFNWGNYTNPELVEKFEQKFDVVNERSKLTRFQRLNLTHPLWRKGPRRAALI